MEKHQNPTNNSQKTLTKRAVRGTELGEEERVWKETASCEARITLMRSMIKHQIAFADLEEFGIDFTNKLKSVQFKNKTVFLRVSQPAMKCKLMDEQMLRKEVMRIKMRMKRDLSEKMMGDKTRPYRRIISYLNKIARDHKDMLNKKYKKKLEHLKAKYKMEEEDEDEEPPVDLQEYGELTVFNKSKYKEIEVKSYEIKVIGDVTLSEEEKAVLKLHNKFSVLDNLQPGGMDPDQEAAIAKLRMEKVKEAEYEGFTNEEKEEMEIIEAKSRMIYDPKEMVYDSRKRRATDLKECTRITLPKPLSPDEESRIEVRKVTQKEIYEKFREKHTNKKHEQKSNLTQKEQLGLKSLLKRINNEEIMVVKTDKSGRFIVTTPDNYVEMGKEHTDKDEEIDWYKLKELEKNVAEHSTAWELIWRTGEDHNHQDRVLRSRNTRSGNNANLSLLYKDHKAGNKTRPVASGNTSYNLGLSNGISELLESVAKARQSPYSVISAEDMLARITRYNSRYRSTVHAEEESITTSTVPTDRGELPDLTEMSPSTVPTNRGELPDLTEMSPSTSTVPSEGRLPDLTEMPSTSTVPCEGRLPSITSAGSPNTSTVPSEDRLPGLTEGKTSKTSTVPADANMVKEMTLVGSDVVALYPSITADRTARIIRDEIIKSEIELEGLDIERALAYIAINKNELEDIEELTELLPKRISNNGSSPTMASIKKNWNPRDQWEFSSKEPSKKQEKLIAGIVAELALKALFKNFCYSFGGKVYYQKSGGPIGVRATGAAAQLVMEHWAREYRAILENSGVQVEVMAGYVDDGRQVTSCLDLGMRFSKETNKFEYRDEWKTEDEMKKSEGETSNQRMARICKEAMDSVNPDLVFTTESQEEFQNERLPTLDFEIWISEGIIRHSYYQKNMKTPFVLMERSAMGNQQKYQILSNELVRRLSNIMIEEIPHNEVIEKIEEFIGELKNSEYKVNQAREIVTSGLRGWKNKIKNRKKRNIPFYRLAQETVEIRLHKDLTERETWYKTKRDREEEEESPSKFRKITGGGRRPSKPWKKTSKKSNLTAEDSKKPVVKSVIFVPHTQNSELAKELREKETELEKITGDKVKVVEKAGRKLEDILANGDPWRGLDCGRENCFLCNTKHLTGKNKKQDCRKRNILYEIRCFSCEDEEIEKIQELFSEDDKKRREMEANLSVPKYVGESGRSAYERGFEHLNLLTSLNKKSFMLRHMLHKHEDKKFEEVKWGMFILKYQRSAFERQIAEAVAIEKESKTSEILNSKAEWNQCQLPRLVTRIGNEETKLLEKEIEEEKKIEEELEKKVRTMRKERNKMRLTTDRNQPARKRQKMEDTDYISIREHWGPPKILAPKKVSYQETENLETDQPMKRLRKTEHLENIRRIDDKIIEGETITEFDIITVDWDRVITEHKERLETEARERKEQLEKKSKKEKHWELYRECKQYLENNDKNWQNRRIERELERKKLERLQEAEEKKEKIKERVKKRKLETEIEAGLKLLPEKEREKIELEEKKQMRLDLIETKKSLWKFRTKEKKQVQNTDRTEKLEQLEKLEDKLKMIENILEEIKETKRKFEEKEKERKEQQTKEWRKKVAIKDKKEQEKKLQIEKQRIKSQHWEMLRWVTRFIQENQENWDKRKKEQEEESNKEINDWNKSKRMEKIKKLKEKWSKDNKKTANENIEVSPVSPVSNWENWREKNRPEGGRNTIEENLVSEELNDKVIQKNIAVKEGQNTIEENLVSEDLSNKLIQKNIAVKLRTSKLDIRNYAYPLTKKPRLQLQSGQSPQQDGKSPPPHSTAECQEVSDKLQQVQSPQRAEQQSSPPPQLISSPRSSASSVKHRSVQSPQLEGRPRTPSTAEDREVPNEVQTVQSPQQAEKPSPHPPSSDRNIEYNISKIMKPTKLKITKKIEDNHEKEDNHNMTNKNEDNPELEDNHDKIKHHQVKKVVVLKPPTHKDNPKKERKKTTDKKKDNPKKERKTTDKKKDNQTDVTTQNIKKYFTTQTTKCSTNKSSENNITHITNTCEMQTLVPDQISTSRAEVVAGCSVLPGEQISGQFMTQSEQRKFNQSEQRIPNPKSDLTNSVPFTSKQLGERIKDQMKPS